MDKNVLKEQVFRYLVDEHASGVDAARKLAEKERSASSEELPQRLWLKISEAAQANTNSHPTIAARIKGMFTPPLIPALALTSIGVLVGAFVLLNRGSVPVREMPLIEISANTSQQKGDRIIAKALRIENTGAGTLARIAGAEDKILLHSGSWKIALNHNELEKPLVFVFPGGALEPLGTAFAIEIGADKTTIHLTEGKIRLSERAQKDQPIRRHDITAPYDGILAAAPLEPEISALPAPPPKPAPRASKYARYIGSTIAVELKNGDRLSGRLRSAHGGTLSIQSASGLLTIRESAVLRVSQN